MADEITLTFGLSILKGDFRFDINAIQEQFDLASARYVSGIQNVSQSAHELIDIGDIATAGLAVFRNRDATNYVEIGLDVSSTFYPRDLLYPGQVAFSWLSGLAHYALANTAAVDLEYLIFER